MEETRERNEEKRVRIPDAPRSMPTQHAMPVVILNRREA